MYSSAIVKTAILITWNYLYRRRMLNCITSRRFVGIYISYGGIQTFAYWSPFKIYNTFPWTKTNDRELVGKQKNNNTKLPDDGRSLSHVLFISVSSFSGLIIHICSGFWRVQFRRAMWKRKEMGGDIPWLCWLKIYPSILRGGKNWSDYDPF